MKDKLVGVEAGGRWWWWWWYTLAEVEAGITEGQVAGGGIWGYSRTSWWKWRLGVLKDKLVEMEAWVLDDKLLEVEAVGY